MNMVNEWICEGVQEQICYSSAFMTVGEMSEYMNRFTVLDVNKGILERHLQKQEKERKESAGKEVDRIREKEKFPAECDAVVFGMDGVNIIVREEGKKKGRPKERPTLEKDVHKKKKASYQNVMCGSISFYTSGDEKYERLESHYVASMPEKGFPQFRKDFEKESENVFSNIEKSGRQIQKIVLCDGARPLWKYIGESKKFTDCHYLVDYYHATEHLSAAAEVIWGKSSDLAKEGYRKWLKTLKKRKGVERVLASLQYYKKGLSKSKMALVEKEITYFKNNKSKMNYEYFVSRGLPIGSGVTEAACKSVVKQRMCRSGMRWGLKKGNGQLVLTIRSIIKSRRWDRYWQELQGIRNCA